MKSTCVVPLLKSPSDIGKLPFGTILNHLDIGKGKISYAGRYIPNERPRRSECFWGWIVTHPKEVEFSEHQKPRQRHLPFAEGTNVDGFEIKEIGFEQACINWFDCEAALVPVQFADDSFGIIRISFYGGDKSFYVMRFDGVAADIVRHSKTMPDARRSIGSDVHRIWVSDEEGRPVLVKSYYNKKAWRGDEVYRS